MTPLMGCEPQPCFCLDPGTLAGGTDPHGMLSVVEFCHLIAIGEQRDCCSVSSLKQEGGMILDLRSYEILYL